jgi:hypothetical protein
MTERGEINALELVIVQPERLKTSTGTERGEVDCLQLIVSQVQPS